jgi:hypothetical protein
MWAVCTLDCRLWIVDCILYNVYDILCIVHGALSSGSRFVPGGSRGRSPPRIVYTAMCRGMHENIYIYIFLSWWKVWQYVESRYVNVLVEATATCRYGYVSLCRYAAMSIYTWKGACMTICDCLGGIYVGMSWLCVAVSICCYVDIYMEGGMRDNM